MSGGLSVLSVAVKDDHGNPVVEPARGSTTGV